MLVWPHRSQVWGAARRAPCPHRSGYAAQNFLLQAAALGLGAVPIGAFDDAEVARA